MGSHSQAQKLAEAMEFFFLKQEVMEVFSQSYSPIFAASESSEDSSLVLLALSACALLMPNCFIHSVSMSQQQNLQNGETSGARLASPQPAPLDVRVCVVAGFID